MAPQASPIRFGIIACSGVAKRWFLPALQAASSARLERVGSREASKAQQYSVAFSCAKFGTYEEVLADPEVDAVYVSTPPFFHEEWVLKAAQHGKHILCEKPAFPDFATASAAVKACRAAGVRLSENYMFRYHPQHTLVSNLVAAGRIGTPLYFHAQFTYPRPPEGDIRIDPDLGGGVFHDSAGYPVAAALLQTKSKPVSVFCQQGWNGTLDTSFTVTIRFQDGQIAQAYVAFGAFYRSRYALVGTAGRIEVLRAYSVAPHLETSVLLETDAGEEKMQVTPANQFQLLLEDFCRCLQKPVDGTTDFESELLLRHAVMEAAHRSSREKREVELAEYTL